MVKIKIKFKKITSLMLVLTLIISILAPYSTALADGLGTGGWQGNGRLPDNPTGYLVQGMGWIISIQEVENTAYKYASQMSATTTTSECSVSLADTYMFDYPLCYRDGEIRSKTGKYAFMHLKSPFDYYATNADCTYKNSKYYTLDSRGRDISQKPFANTYSVRKARMSSGDYTTTFSSVIPSDTAVKNLMQVGTLNYTTLQPCINSAALQPAIKSFVGLWEDSSTVDDKVNAYVFGTATSGYYDKLVRNLEILLIVNEMCGGCYGDEIDKYCTYLNANGSDKFVAVVVGAAVHINMGTGKSIQTVATLPAYYGIRTGLGESGFLHWNGAAGGNIFASTGLTTNEWADLRDKYNSIRQVNSRFGKGNTNGLWWGIGDYYAAGSVYPTGIFDEPSGNVSYTYLNLSGIEPTPSDLPSILIPPNDPPEDVKARFFITADSDDFVIRVPEKRAEVDVVVDMSQSDTLLQKIAAVYQAVGNQPARLTVEVARTATGGFTDDTGLMMDANTNSTVFPCTISSADSATFVKDNLVWMDGSDADAYSILTGKQQVKFKDMGIAISSKSESTYHANVKLEWDTPNGVFTLQFYSTGEHACNDAFPTLTTEYKAHDACQWLLKQPGDEFFYSSFKNGNFAEIKHNDVGAESFEAMAGIPTDEDLFLGAGYNEYMTNMEIDIASDSDKYREIIFTKTFEKCAGDDTPCAFSCGGHPVTCSGTITNADGSTSTCGNSVKVYCNGKDSTATAKCDSCGGTVTKTDCPITDYSSHVVGGVTHYTGSGCECNEANNCVHTHEHTYTVKVKIPIAMYYYLKINKLDAWQGQEIEYDYNDKLLNTNKDKISPSTKLTAFYGNDGYQPGNGRLIFSKTLNDDKAGYLGKTLTVNLPSDSTVRIAGKTSGCGHTSASKCDAKMTDDINTYLKNNLDKDKVTVVSDFAYWTNTDGKQQVLTYNTYQSKELDIKNGVSLTFEETDSNKEVSLNEKEGYNFTSSGPAWGSAEEAKLDLWTRDYPTGLSYRNVSSSCLQEFKSYSSDNWESYYLTRVGYTGIYNPREEAYKPGDRYEEFNEDLINLVNVGGAGTLANALGLSGKLRQLTSGSDTGNDAWKILHMDINDYFEKKTGSLSNIYRPSVEGDSNSPVVNGEWDTGNVYYLAKKIISYPSSGNNTAGIDYNEEDNNSNYDYYVELGYTKGKEKVNNVVVHDPVAVSPDAKVMSMSIEYDKRTDDTAIKGLRPSLRTGVCPGDFHCEYKKLLTYDEHEKNASGKVFSEHSEDCYVEVQIVEDIHDIGGGERGPIGVFNVHEHDDNTCYTDYDMVITPADTAELKLAGDTTYYIEVAGAASSTAELGSSGEEVIYPGVIVKGLVTVPGTQDDIYTLKYEVGSIPTEALNNRTKSAERATKLAIKDIIGTDVVEIQAAQGGEIRTNSNIWLTTVSARGYAVHGEMINKEVYYNNFADGYIRLYAVRSTQPIISDTLSNTNCGVYKCELTEKLPTDMTQFDYPYKKAVIKCVTCGDTREFDLTTIEGYEGYKQHLLSGTGFIHTIEKAEVTYEKIGTIRVDGDDGIVNYNISHPMNKHVCTSNCLTNSDDYLKKTLVCTNPHHYIDKSGMIPYWVNPNSSDDYYNDPTHHTQECYKACNDNSKHTSHTDKEITAVTSSANVADRRGTISYIGLDRSFTVEFPTVGDFYGNGASGILDCTETAGLGYINGMDTERWIRDKYVTFSFDVLVKAAPDDAYISDSDGDGEYIAFTAGTPISWYDYFEGTNTGTFYCPLENSEQIDGTATFNVMAVNNPVTEGVAQENLELTNKVRSYIGLAAKHDAYKLQYLDVIGYIGALSITDTGDPRFATLFKRTTDEYVADTDNYLIPNLVPRVEYRAPNTIVSDKITPRLETSANTAWQDTWQTLTPGLRFERTTSDNYSYGYLPNWEDEDDNPGVKLLGGKWRDSLMLPLTPQYLNIEGLKQQAMRVGYDLYMDVQTVGNYYGRNHSSSSTTTTDQQVAVKPNYYLVYTGADGKTGAMKLDVYAANGNSEYSSVNKFASLKELAEADTEEKRKAVVPDASAYMYLDWGTEKARRNTTNYEQAVTAWGDLMFDSGPSSEYDGQAPADKDPASDSYNENWKPETTSGRSVSDKIHRIGTANLLNLIDEDKTYVGSMVTQNSGDLPEFKNGHIYATDGTDTGSYLNGPSYIIQAQRYHFTVGLPSSAKFVKHGELFNTENLNKYEELAKLKGSHIICTLEIQASGQVWDLKYDRDGALDSGQSDSEETIKSRHTYMYRGKEYEYNGVDPIIAILDPVHTSKDDLDTVGTH